jgi:energy-converting hydrogenase Eha subunit H
MANFKGLVGHQNPVQTPENGARIVFEEGYAGKMSFLPFLGEAVTLTGKKHGQKTVFELPRIEKGAVVCTEPK